MAANNNDLKLTLRLNAENKEFVGQVRASAGAVGDLGDKAQHAGNELNALSKDSNIAGSGLSSLRGQVFGVIGGFSALATAINAKDRLGEYQDMRTQITALVGSQEAWVETEQYLNQVAEDHNKTLDVLSGSYARLLTLQNGGLITHQQVIDIFEGMSNAASANGASNEHLGQVMYGLQQAMASGVVRAEEFNQVTEPMPDLLIKLAAAANTTVGGLRNMVNSGEMTSKLFGETLVKALAEYDGAAARTADNVTAQSAAFDRAYLDMVKAYETPISSVFSDSIAVSTSVMETMADNANTLSTIIGATLFAAVGRGTVAIADLTKAKLTDVISDRQKLQATVTSTQAELSAIQAEVRRLEVMQVSNNQKFRAIGAEKALTAARVQEVVVTKQLTSAQAQMNVASRAGSALMGAMGGPAGIVMMAAGALSYFAVSANDAQKDTEGLKDEVNALLGRMNELQASRIASAIERQKTRISELREEYARVALTPAPGQTLWQKITEDNSEMRERQIREAKETASQVTAVQLELSQAERDLSALEDKLREAKKPTQSPSPSPESNGDADTAGSRLLANLQRQAVLYGQTSEVAKVRYELEQGSLKGINADLEKQLLLQAQIIDKKRAEAEADKKKTDDIDKFYDESDALNTRYQMRLAIQADYENRAKIQEQYAYVERQDQLQAQFQAAYAQAKGNQELMNDLEKEYFLNKQALRQEHELILSDIAKAAAKDRADYEREVIQESLRSYQSFVSGLGTVFSQISTMMAQSGEDSKALFYANQAVAIANAIVSTELAATNALKYNENMTLAQALVSQAAVRAVGYASVGIIAGQTIAGQAHDGINSVPRENEGTWLLKAGEMVLNNNQAEDFRWMVSAMQQMRTMFTVMASGAANQSRASSGGTIVNIHNLPGQNTREERSVGPNGEKQVDIYIQRAVKASMQAMYEDADNGGPVSTRIKGAA